MFKEELKKELESILEKTPVIYKYINFNDGLSLLTNSTILIRKPAKFNDPFDCYPGLIDFNNMPDQYIKDLINQHHQGLSRQDRRKKIISAMKKPRSKLIDLLRDDFINSERQTKGISCFSENHDSLLMWAQYADSHKGLCIGFNVQRLYNSLKKSEFNEIALLKVLYTKELTPIDIFHDGFKSVINWLRVKSIDWNYENEIRIILGPVIFNNGDIKLIKFDDTAVQELYFGSQIDIENQKIVEELVNMRFPKIAKFNTCLSPNSFSLVTTKI